MGWARVADRFTLVELAARGGMGEIWRAQDEQTGELVALKRALASGIDQGRFHREAQILARLRHPALVSHVAHGEDAAGSWLAMAWIEGETLAARLERRALPLADTLSVGGRIAGALAALHDAGVVHRDIKPSNIMLADGEPDRAILLDLGVARTSLADRTLTGADILLGTIGYMAPEQAQSGQDVDARADVFALGCVLFECLTGELAFPGDHAVAVLARLLTGSPPRVRSRRGDLPAGLDELVAAMLAREPAERPRDGAAVVAALGSLEVVDAGLLGTSPRRTGSLTRSEQHFTVAVVVEFAGGSDEQLTVAVGVADARLERLGVIARELGGATVLLHSTGALVALAERGTAVDRAHLAAMAARTIVEALPDARVGIAAGLVTRRSRLPAGAVLERAGALARTGGVGTIALDPTVGDLLRDRYTLHATQDRLVLGNLVQSPEDLRVCGQPTPFVGRDKELALLEATVVEAIEENAPRALFVSAAPGIGKSRLGRELLRRLRARGDLEILTARAEVVRAGAVHGLLRQLLRGAADIALVPGAQAEAPLRAYLRGLPGLDAPERVGDFLSEVLGASPVRPGREHDAARGEPDLMARWVRRSVREWLAAAAAVRPLVLYLEDLHWGDEASLGHLADALRGLRSAPLVLLAFGRPEAARLLEREPITGLHELRLRPLGPRAAERIVRAVLGARADGARLIERADGNPYYLEELLRFVADARDGELPASVSALLHARIEDLDPELRRILRAASVLGERVAPDALAALVGGSPDEVRPALAALVAAELLDERDGVWVFRHALLRETAHATLEEADAIAAHTLAADWLERQDDRDPREILEHLERAGADDRLSAYCIATAELAHEASSDGVLLELAERGLKTAPSPIVEGKLRAFRALGLAWADRPADSIAETMRVLQLLPPSEPLWISALGTLIFSAGAIGDHAAMGFAIQALLSTPITSTRRTTFTAIVGAVIALDVVGKPDLARGLLERSPVPPPGSAGEAQRLLAGAEIAIYQRGHGGRCYQLAHQAREIAGHLGDRAVAILADIYAHGPQIWWSRCPDNLERTRRLCREHEGNPLRISLGWLDLWHAFAARMLTGERALLERLLAAPDLSRAETARLVLVFADIDDGELDRATAELDRAPWLTARTRPTIARARVALARGAPEQALELLAQAEGEAQLMVYPYFWEWLHLTRADALLRLDRRPEAEAAVQAGLSRISDDLDGIDDEAVRREIMSYVIPVAELRARAMSLELQRRRVPCHGAPTGLG